MAGEALTLEGESGMRRWRYWEPELPLVVTGKPPSKGEAVEEIRHRLRESVRLGCAVMCRWRRFFPRRDRFHVRGGFHAGIDAGHKVQHFLRIIR